MYAIVQISRVPKGAQVKSLPPGLATLGVVRA